MRKLLYIICLLVLTLPFSKIGTCQDDSKLTLEIKTNDATSNIASDGSVTLNVSGDHPGYTYLLFDKEPWQGGKELQRSGITNETNFIFTNLPVGNYLVCVMDETEHSQCQNATIKSK
jgi:predicted phage tail protein